MKKNILLLIIWQLLCNHSIMLCQSSQFAPDSMIVHESQGATEYYFADYKDAQKSFLAQCNNDEIYKYSTLNLSVENEKEFSSKGYLHLIKSCLSDENYNFLQNQKRYILGFGLIINSDGRIIARSVIEKPVVSQHAKINKLTPAEINCLLEFSKSLNFNYQFQSGKLSTPFLIKYTYYLGKLRPN